jgi:hypothetical protein
MESTGSYIELTALETPRFRSATDGCLLFKSQSLVTVIPTTSDASTQTDDIDSVQPLLVKNGHVAHFSLSTTIREKSLSIGLHVALIATFETLFFFQFVSGLADKGIVSVVDRLSKQLFGGCQNLTFGARLALLETLDLLANVSGLVTYSEVAKEERTVTNNQLQLASWLFTGSLYLLWLVAAALSFCRKGGRHKVPWATILLENAVMIGILAAYEGIFVNVIVLRYDTITLPEIEDFAFNNAYDACI